MESDIKRGFISFYLLIPFLCWPSERLGWGLGEQPLPKSTYWFLFLRLPSASVFSPDFKAFAFATCPLTILKYLQSLKLPGLLSSEVTNPRLLHILEVVESPCHPLAHWDYSLGHTWDRLGSALEMACVSGVLAESSLPFLFFFWIIGIVLNVSVAVRGSLRSEVETLFFWRWGTVYSRKYQQTRNSFLNWVPQIRSWSHARWRESRQRVRALLLQLILMALCPAIQKDVLSWHWGMTGDAHPDCLKRCDLCFLCSTHINLFSSAAFGVFVLPSTAGLPTTFGQKMGPLLPLAFHVLSEMPSSVLSI